MPPTQTPAMSQKIFEMDLAMEIVSLYLLCCGLADAGIVLSEKSILERWNGSETELRSGLDLLVDRGILLRILSDQVDRNVYRVAAPDHWRRS
jgi:hypothetical protein